MAPVKGDALLGASEALGLWRSWNVQMVPTQPQPGLRCPSRRHRSPFAERALGKPAKLPGLAKGAGCSTSAVSLQLGWRSSASFLF